MIKSGDSLNFTLRGVDSDILPYLLEAEDDEEPLGEQIMARDITKADGTYQTIVPRMALKL